MQSGNKDLPREKREEILENETPSIRQEIPKEETYDKYGDASRKIEIWAIGEHGGFARIHFTVIPQAVSLIAGIFVYTVGNKPISAGYAKAGANVGENRELGAVFCVKGFKNLRKQMHPQQRYNY